MKSEPYRRNTILHGVCGPEPVEDVGILIIIETIIAIIIISTFA